MNYFFSENSHIGRCSRRHFSGCLSLLILNQFLIFEIFFPVAVWKTRDSYNCYWHESLFSLKKKCILHYAYIDEYRGVSKIRFCTLTRLTLSRNWCLLCTLQLCTERVSFNKYCTLSDLGRVVKTLRDTGKITFQSIPKYL
jgi:hypothetical protein